jgi:hypothetical protein
VKNTLKAIMMIALALTISLHAEAKKKKSPAKAKTKMQHVSMVGSSAGTGKKVSSSSHGGPVSTDVVFDGSMINGRYHTAGEAVATVETEKKMNELVGFRRDFKDRLVVERARLKGQ